MMYILANAPDSALPRCPLSRHRGIILLMLPRSSTRACYTHRRARSRNLKPVTSTVMAAAKSHQHTTHQHTTTHIYDVNTCTHPAAQCGQHCDAVLMRAHHVLSFRSRIKHTEKNRHCSAALVRDALSLRVRCDPLSVTTHRVAQI
jgi:hypothetical protein